MFEFRFLDDDKATNTTTGDDNVTSNAISEEIHPSTDAINTIIAANCINTLRLSPEFGIKHISAEIIEALSSTDIDSPILKANQNCSDLVTGEYEGGLKIWECTYDLVTYILEQKISLGNKNVLDLGCGAGVLGILALINGAKVHFQDYNEDVLKYITIPNVFLNKLNEEVFNKCKFYSGDWSSFVTATEDDFQNGDCKFDYIFTSETIYNMSNYEKLHAVFEKRLKTDGVIYLASKTYYFGVGGGLRTFEDYLTQHNIFNFATCWKYSQGVQREILKIEYKV